MYSRPSPPQRGRGRLCAWLVISAWRCTIVFFLAPPLKWCRPCLTLFSFVLVEKEERKDKNPEEMNRLRDQLVGTFKEQMDIRLISLEKIDKIARTGWKVCKFSFAFQNKKKGMVFPCMLSSCQRGMISQVTYYLESGKRNYCFGKKVWKKSWVMDPKICTNPGIRDICGRPW